MTKRCSNKMCVAKDVEQPLENFSKRAASKDGLSYTCKACERVTAKKSYKGKKNDDRDERSNIDVETN